MLKLTDTHSLPPGEWKWTEPITGHTIRGRAWSKFISDVRSHRVANLGCDISDGWQERFQEEYCIQNSLDGTEWCSDEKYYAPNPDRPLHWSDIRNFLFSMIQWVSGGRQLVNQEEAERRAAICATCPKNVELHVACPSCARLDELIAETKGDRATSLDASLKNCEVCRCFLPTLVWYPNESISKKGLTYPSHCWHNES